VDAAGAGGPGAGSALAWRQPRARRREFVLEAGDAVLATLRTSGYAASRGELTAAGRRFTLRAAGRRVTVTAAAGGGGGPGGGQVAVLHRSWTGARGTVELPGGERLAWARAGGWPPRWLLAGQAGQQLAAIRPRTRLARFEATVELDPAAAARPDLLPLLGLAWFTLVAMRSHPVVAGSGG
jgi:hypothetical protein